VRDRRSRAALRGAWARFASLANDTGRPDRADELVALLAPGACADRRGGCDMEQLLENVATIVPLSSTLRTSLVAGDRGFARLAHWGDVRFRRVGGEWRVSDL
jgi:hypothetical protein